MFYRSGEIVLLDVNQYRNMLKRLRDDYKKDFEETGSYSISGALTLTNNLIDHLNGGCNCAKEIKTEPQAGVPPAAVGGSDAKAG